MTEKEQLKKRIEEIEREEFNLEIDKMFKESKKLVGKFFKSEGDFGETIYLKIIDIKKENVRYSYEDCVCAFFDVCSLSIHERPTFFSFTLTHNLRVADIKKLKNSEISEDTFKKFWGIVEDNINKFNDKLS